MTSPLDDEETPSFDMCNCRKRLELRTPRFTISTANVKLLYSRSLSSVDTYFEDRHLDPDEGGGGGGSLPIGTGVENQTRIDVSACLLLLFSLKNFIEITKEQETCQRAESREREAFKFARAQPDNRRKQKEKGGGTLKRKKQMMGD